MIATRSLTAPNTSRTFFNICEICILFELIFSKCQLHGNGNHTHDKESSKANIPRILQQRSINSSLMGFHFTVGNKCCENTTHQTLMQCQNQRSPLPGIASQTSLPSSNTYLCKTVLHILQNTKIEG